ncbi:MAG: alkaline phosphatase family protein, partial [Verrucomicrobiae bacterium]|nr:alkaline phosphatase family protein [Verrucomicrobiae bacterium]
MTIRKILTLLLLAAGSMNAFSSEPPKLVSSEPPKLVITILVDQLRYDYLERFHDQFSEGGFRLLMDNGAFLTDAHYNYMPTITGPGHASFLSGAPPAMHGIISNQWFDHRTGANVNCVSDPAVNGVGADDAAGQRSPRNFFGSTLADEMRLRFHSKVIGISHKDRGAILPAGKKPAGAYWFHSASGNFITSTYYRQELPEWVKEFNERKLPTQFIGQTWKRLLDPSLYQWPDDAAGEGKLAGEDKVTFDHQIVASEKEGFETIIPTPFGNQLLLEFALAALEGEKLGTGTHPDLLSVSFSSNDYAGHRFGPYSQEAQDITLRLDLQLNEFFKQVDQKIGLEKVYIVLTADHGVAPTPEFAAEQGLDGYRVDPVEQMRD